MISLISKHLTIPSIHHPRDISQYCPSLPRHYFFQFSSRHLWFSSKSEQGPDLYSDPDKDHGRACRSVHVLSSLDSKPKDTSNSASSGAYYGYTDSISVVSATLFTEFHYSRTLDGVKLLIGQLLNLVLLMYLFG